MTTTIDYLQLVDGTPAASGDATKTLATSRGLDYELDNIVVGDVNAIVDAGLLHNLTQESRRFVLSVTDINEPPMLVQTPSTYIYRVELGQPLEGAAIPLGDMFADPEEDPFVIRVSANSGAPLNLSYNADTRTLEVTPRLRTSSVSTLTANCVQGGQVRASGSWLFDVIGEPVNLRGKRLTETPDVLTAARGSLESR